jgi:flagellar basal body-associated protein FliL
MTLYAPAITASDASAWVAIVTALVASLTGGAVAVIAALRGERAAGKTAALSDRVEAQSMSLRAVRTDLTTVATAVPPPLAAGSPPGNVPADVPAFVPPRRSSMPEAP